NDDLTRDEVWLQKIDCRLGCRLGDQNTAFRVAVLAGAAHTSRSVLSAPLPLVDVGTHLLGAMLEERLGLGYLNVCIGNDAPNLTDQSFAIRPGHDVLLTASDAHALRNFAAGF
ncbi:MAG: hypothetical protein AAF658_02590, partial [Myxococcota bacterium]